MGSDGVDGDRMETRALRMERRLCGELHLD